MARAKDHQTASAMAQAATRLLASLDAGLKSNAAYSFENETRDVWHFFPNWPKRSGIPLSELSEKQREPVMKMLSFCLARRLQGTGKGSIDPRAQERPERPGQPKAPLFHLDLRSTVRRVDLGLALRGSSPLHQLHLGGRKAFLRHPFLWGASPIRVTKGDHKGA